MLRRLHSLAGLALAGLLVVIAATGVCLSLQPAFDRLAHPALSPGVSVAALSEAAARRHQRVDQLSVRGDGAVTAGYNDGQGKQTEVVDPRTGAGRGPYQTSDTFRVFANLHRSLLLGDGGRIAVVFAALGLLGLSLTGITMLARSLGGARALLKPIRGDAARRWHGEIGRLALAGLLLSSLTAAFLSATTFGLIPTSQTNLQAAPASGGPAAPIRRLGGLASIDVVDLDRLTYPARDDATATFDVTSAQGEALIDPSTGRVLSFAPASTMDSIARWAYLLHTGRLSWGFALLLGLSAAASPVLAATGFLVWRRRAKGARPLKSAPASSSDIVILVGSEGGSTWGFADTLKQGLSAAGHRVHVAAMDDVDVAALNAERLLILAATYGDGDAPALARRFLDKLMGWERRIPVAVLGFGDRTFRNFCGYAQEVAAALDAKDWPLLMPLKRIDRRSAQEFAQWGRDLGALLGCELELAHIAEPPKTTALELASREMYGEAVGAPVAILRFCALHAGGRPGSRPAI
jgi:sulfite reductase (NADPH) flavoprotein alpha-component